MLYKITSAAFQGIEAYPVDVEVDISFGMANFITVGLPDAAVRESKERVQAALKNCGFSISRRRILINLAPADRRKEGSAFDLPIALGLLAHLDVFPEERLQEYLFLGELALDGSLKPGRGVLSAAILARKSGFRGIVVPASNATEASLVQGIKVLALKNLPQVIQFLREPDSVKEAVRRIEDVLPAENHPIDFKEIRGQQHVKRAMEVAAAGGHNIMMMGPPGTGKTMIARRLPTIMPPMTLEEIIDVTRIYSAAGLLKEEGIVRSRPFRSPHHTISAAGMTGGGTIPRPGNVSLAHHGVLFLDELTEFQKQVLEGLRQPLEDGIVTISRAAMTVTYPADFMLVAAMNPCDDAFSASPEMEVQCTPSQRQRYYSQISGPLVDRIDIQIDVPKVEFRDMISDFDGEDSATVRDRVTEARSRQLKRFRRKNIYCNAAMGNKEVKQYCKVNQEGEELLETAMDKLGFSARAYTRVLKVARTVADLAGEETLNAIHISEAIQYRILDRLS